MVQGVYFRASAARAARELGITGWAINLPDGRVEVLAVGSESAITLMRDWLRVGPPAARVDDVSWTIEDTAQYLTLPTFRTG